MYLDLNGFKAINDTYGHAVGDEVLRDVAARLRKIIRQPDTIARLGGDEFAVLVGHDDAATDLGEVRARICRGMGAPFEVPGGVVTLSASIGTASFPADGATVEELLSVADANMYKTKTACKAVAAAGGNHPNTKLAAPPPNAGTSQPTSRSSSHAAGAGCWCSKFWFAKADQGDAAQVHPWSGQLHGGEELRIVRHLVRKIYLLTQT